MAVVNSFAKFFGAEYPLESEVVDTRAAPYGDDQNVLNGSYGGGGSGDATAANQAAILAALGQIQGGGFNSSTDSLEAIRDVSGLATISPEDRQAIIDGLISGLGGIDVTVSQPIAEDGTSIVIVRGDDYSSDDARAIVWTGASEDQWPDLTGATITMAMTRGAQAYQFVPVVVTPTGTQSIQLTLTSTETDIPTGVYTYSVRANLSSGRDVTLIRGTFTVTLSEVEAND